MGKSFFELLLTMLKVRKDRAMASSLRVQKDLQRVKGFKHQLDSYAKEYETQWMNASRTGEKVSHLQVQMAFGNRLRETALAQETELRALNQQALNARHQALKESERYKTLLKFQQRKKQQETAAHERQQQHELEDLLQARISNK
jgi:flagellar biosynthesis chaperone FliJ